MSKIFIYWDCGFSNCPTIIKNCLKSWIYYNKNYQIITLDDNNLINWIDINELIKNKNITKTSKSDIIRIFLLKKYGGIWVDATVFCVKPLDEWLNDYIENGFFAFSFDSKCDRMISSWFLYGDKDNYLINRWYESVLEYITKANKIGIEHNPLITINEWNNCDKYNNHYFWFHYLFGDNYKIDDLYKNKWDIIKKKSSKEPHYIQLIGFQTKINNEFILNYKNMAPMYKLTYRYDFNKCNDESILNYLLNSLN